MKKKLAFVDLTNFTTWPMGGMLEYERALLPYFETQYDLELWGVDIDNEGSSKIMLDGRVYNVNVFAHCKRKRKLFPNFWRGLALIKYRKRFYNTYDVIYVHTATCAVALSHIINPEHTKLVYHHHCFSYLKDNRLFALVQKPFYKIALKKSDLSFIVADSKSVNDYSVNCGFKHKRAFLPIGSPVCVENFDREKILCRIDNRRVENDSMYFVYAGRIDSWKNVGLLIKAFYLYLHKRPNSKLTIIGSGPKENSVKQLIDNLKIQGRVIMLGSQPHSSVCKQLESADAFLISSKGEGWSVAVLEAFAAGLPVVCGNVQGLKNEVTNDVTGIIANEYSEKGFYQAMLKIQNRIKELSLNALAESERYHAKSISAHIINEIEMMISAPQ